MATATVFKRKRLKELCPVNAQPIYTTALREEITNPLQTKVPHISAFLFQQEKTSADMQDTGFTTSLGLTDDDDEAEQRELFDVGVPRVTETTKQNARITHPYRFDDLDAEQASLMAKIRAHSRLGSRRSNRTDNKKGGQVTTTMTKKNPFCTIEDPVAATYYEQLLHDDQDASSMDHKESVNRVITAMALDSSRKTASQGERFGNHFYAGVDALVQSKSLIAHSLFTDALNNTGDTTNTCMAYINRSTANMLVGQHKTAIDDANLALRLNSRSVHAYYNRGVCFAHLKQHDWAIVDFSKVISMDPSFPKCFLSRALSYLENGAKPLALRDVRSALGFEPHNPALHMLAGEINKSLQINHQALIDFTNVIEINPSETKAYFNRALTYQAENQPLLALRDFSRTIWLAPDVAIAYYSRGMLHLQLMNYHDAMDDFVTANKLECSNPLIEEAIKTTQTHVNKTREQTLPFESTSLETTLTTSSVQFNSKHGRELITSALRRNREAAVERLGQTGKSALIGIQANKLSSVSARVNSSSPYRATSARRKGSGGRVRPGKFDTPCGTTSSSSSSSFQRLAVHRPKMNIHNNRFAAATFSSDVLRAGNKVLMRLSATIGDGNRGKANKVCGHGLKHKDGHDHHKHSDSGAALQEELAKLNLLRPQHPHQHATSAS